MNLSEQKHEKNLSRNFHTIPTMNHLRLSMTWTGKLWKPNFVINLHCCCVHGATILFFRFRDFHRRYSSMLQFEQRLLSSSVALENIIFLRFIATFDWKTSTIFASLAFMSQKIEK